MAPMSSPASDTAPTVVPRPTAPGPTARTPPRYDVVRPSPGPHPAAGTVLVVHAASGAPPTTAPTPTPRSKAFADAGFHVALAEYRRVGMPGGGVPGTLDDVREVVTAISPTPTCPSPLVLVGHSAGGHLATWAAGQPWAPGGPRGVAGVVSFAGVVDLGAAHPLHLGDDAARAFVGRGPAALPGRAADPMTCRRRSRSASSRAERRHRAHQRR